MGRYLFVRFKCILFLDGKHFSAKYKNISPLCGINMGGLGLDRYFGNLVLRQLKEILPVSDLLEVLRFPVRTDLQPRLGPGLQLRGQVAAEAAVVQRLLGAHQQGLGLELGHAVHLGPDMGAVFDKAWSVQYSGKEIPYTFKILPMNY